MISSERYKHLLRTLQFLLRSGQYREIARRFGERVYDESALVGMHLDLQEFTSTRALPDQLTVRSLRPGEIPTILDLTEAGLSRQEVHDRVIRHQMLRAEINTCYIAEDTQGDTLFIQWVIGADQNDVLERRIGGLYPRLAPAEVLIEYAYTLPSRRGAGIMPSVTSHLLEKARMEGAHRAVTFIPAQNKPSLRIHLEMGFVPHLLLQEKCRFFVRSSRSTPISEIPREI